MGGLAPARVRDPRYLRLLWPLVLILLVLTSGVLFIAAATG